LACASVQERIGGSIANRRASLAGQASTKEPGKCVYGKGKGNFCHGEPKPSNTINPDRKSWYWSFSLWVV